VFDQKVQQNILEGECCLLDKLIELHQLGELSEKDVLNEAVTFMLAVCEFYLQRDTVLVHGTTRY